MRKEQRGKSFAGGILLLEQIFKRLARVGGSRGAGRGRGGCGCRGGRRGVFFNGSAKLVERAFVALVLARDAFRHGLHAFKPRSAVEIRALFAAMQIESTLQAFPVGVESRQQHSAAIRTARACDRTDHARRPRPDLILSWMSFRCPFFFFLRLIGVLITPLPILPLQEYLRRDTPSYSDSVGAKGKSAAPVNISTHGRVVDRESKFAGPNARQPFGRQIRLQKFSRLAGFG